jgi:hypothetical protein
MLADHVMPAVLGTNEMTERTVRMNNKLFPPPARGLTAKEQARSSRRISKSIKKTNHHSCDNRENDIRFRKPEFCQAVRRVLEHLGKKPTYGNFRKYDGVIDWEAFAEYIGHPTRVALCHVLDGQGQKVMVKGRPVVLAREIAACSESEAAEILGKESKLFVKWW